MNPQVFLLSFFALTGRAHGLMGLILIATFFFFCLFFVPFHMHAGWLALGILMLLALGTPMCTYIARSLATGSH